MSDLIKNLEYLIQFLPGKSIYAGETLTCAIAALREKQQREAGCDTCNKGKAHFGDVLWAINKSGLAVINIEGAQANVQFDCCPMCGRQLSGKAEQEEGGE